MESRPASSRYSVPQAAHRAPPPVTCSRSPQRHIQPTRRAGTPSISPKAGTSLVITAPAPTKAYSPSVTPQTMVALAPIEVPRRTRVGRYSSRRETWLLGLITLVKTQLGPQKTSSSRVTPSYTETLFWILTLLPIRTPFMTTTFWPSEQPVPITAPGMTWQKCQILVPPPTDAPSST